MLFTFYLLYSVNAFVFTSLNNSHLLLSIDFPLQWISNTDPSLTFQNIKSIKSLSASITRGRWNAETFGLLNTTPTGGTVIAEFEDNAMNLEWFHVLQQIDLLLSSMFALLQRENCVGKNNKVFAFSPEERIGIDIMYAIQRYFTFASKEDISMFKELFLNKSLVDSDFASISLKFTTHSVSLNYTSLHDKNRIVFPYDLNSLKLPLASHRIKHYFISTDLFSQKYFLQANFKVPQGVEIFGVIPSFCYLNISDSVVSIDNQRKKITEFCTFYQNSVVQFTCKVPSALSVILHFDLRMKMKHFESYPYDANRGIDFIAPVLVIDGKEQFLNSLLLPLPQPDFSMPYNVMVISCSISFIFSITMYKILTKDPYSPGLLVEKIQKLLKNYPNICKFFNKK